jgi:hypothetical protein
VGGDDVMILGGDDVGGDDVMLGNFFEKTLPTTPTTVPVSLLKNKTVFRCAVKKLNLLQKNQSDWRKYNQQHNGERWIIVVRHSARIYCKPNEIAV